MVKHLNIAFDDVDFEIISEKKRGERVSSWKEFIMKLIKEHEE